MNISMEEKKEEALKRMSTIVDHFHLGDKLVNYLMEDKLYYSYAYSMDTINYDDRYAQAVKNFESENEVYVYHAIEAKLSNGDTLLSFLFVSDYREEWQNELLDGDSILTYSFCVETPDYGEMGWIEMAAPMGYLMRIA